MTHDLRPFIDADFCYLTTIGRISGRPHTIEIWFALQQTTLYLLSGGRDTADWVKNLQRASHVQVRIHERVLHGRARVVTDQDEDALARHLLFEKYAPRSSEDLSEWSRSALPIAVDLSIENEVFR
jgi:deazaflavin-dependent oxidoreductase (nitroreductase family)